MNATFRHWLKFNLVGIIGACVQLTTLAFLNRFLRGHYLFASVVALEVAVLHNFIWHLRYTWKDRRGPVLAQLIRFHLTNGLLSLVGNLLLMRALVASAHVPVLAANAVAIVSCSFANFFLSHYWIFTARKPHANPIPYPATGPRA